MSPFKTRAIQAVRQSMRAGISGQYSYCKGRLPRAFPSLIDQVGTKMLFDRLELWGWAVIGRKPDDLGFDDLFGDCFAPDHASTVPGGMRTINREEKDAKFRLEEEGQWFYLAHVCHPDTRTAGTNTVFTLWVDTDSCGGFVGDDFYGSGYDTDFYVGCIDAIAAMYGVPRWCTVHPDPKHRPFVWFTAMKLAGAPFPEHVEADIHAWR